MKKHFPKIIAVTLGVAALAVSVPVSAFAKSSNCLLYTSVTPVTASVLVQAYTVPKVPPPRVEAAWRSGHV